MKKLLILILFVLIASDIVFCNTQSFAAYSYNLGDLSPGDTPLTLNSGGSDNFTAVLRSGNSNIGVILLNGRGENVYDGHVILPLRLDLNSIGYSTLSIDLPPAPTSSGDSNPYSYNNYQIDAANGTASVVFQESYERIRAATQELQSLGCTKELLIGFSLGSRIGSAYMSYGSAGSIPIIGYAGIGMGSDSVASLLDTPTSIAGITVPMLDLYGSLDDHDVLSSATARKNAYNGSSYTQIEQTGAAHQWVGYEPQLDSYVESFSSQVTAATVPEPATMLLLGLGLMGLAGVRRKFQK